MNLEQLEQLVEQFRKMSEGCISNGEGQQAFNYCADAIEAIIPKHNWYFYMNGTYCTRCGEPLGSKRECS